MKKMFFIFLPSLLFILSNSITNWNNIISSQTSVVENRLEKNMSIKDIEIVDITKDQTRATQYLRYGNRDNSAWIYRIKIKNAIYSYKNIEFVQNTNAWASWGNTPYNNRSYLVNNLNTYLSGLDPKTIENKKMESSYDVNQNSVDWLHVKDYQGSAVVEIVVRFHFTWYYNAVGEEFYFQIGIYMYGETWSSFSGGGIWADLGFQLKFTN